MIKSFRDRRSASLHDGVAIKGVPAEVLRLGRFFGVDRSGS